MSDEVILLLAVFAGLYLADCLLLLQPTAALLNLPYAAKGRKGTTPSGWRDNIGPVGLSLGVQDMPVRNRIVALLNPLTPWNLQFRCPPLAENGTAPTLQRLPLHRLLWLRLQVRRLTPLLLLHAILLFGVLPYFLIVDRLAPLLVFLGLAFGTALTILILCLRLRRVLRIRRSTYWSLGLQTLICLPTSLNFPRKLALMVEGHMTIADWLPETAPTMHRRLAQDLQRAIEIHCDSGDGINSAKISAARNVARDYGAEQI